MFRKITYKFKISFKVFLDSCKCKRELMIMAYIKYIRLSYIRLYCNFSLVLACITYVFLYSFVRIGLYYIRLYYIRLCYIRLYYLRFLP